MTKGNKQRGNREAKKPKKEQPKAVATAAIQASKAPILGSKNGNANPTDTRARERVIGSYWRRNCKRRLGQALRSVLPTSTGGIPTS